VFRGETSVLVLGVETESDAEDFVAAFLSSLDGKTVRTLVTDAFLFETLSRGSQ